jgi:hypothetical protein
MKTPQDFIKEAENLKEKLEKEADEWQKPFMNILKISNVYNSRKEITHNGLKIWRETERGNYCYRISYYVKNVGIKEKFLWLNSHRLSLTQEEALKAVSEYKVFSEFVNFDLV